MSSHAVMWSNNWGSLLKRFSKTFCGRLVSGMAAIEGKYAESTTPPPLGLGHTDVNFGDLPDGVDKV